MTTYGLSVLLFFALLLAAFLLYLPSAYVKIELNPSDCLCWFTTFIYLPFYLFSLASDSLRGARVQNITVVLCALSLGSTAIHVYTNIHRYSVADARHTRSHIPIPLSIYFSYSTTWFRSFARSLSIIDLLELVRGKIIKFNASKPEIDGLFISIEWSQAKEFQCIYMWLLSHFLLAHTCTQLYTHPIDCAVKYISCK